MAGKLRVLSVVLFLTLSTVYGQPNSRAALSTSSLSRVVVSRSTGDVFLADQDTVYLLPGDLSEITSNVGRTVGQTPEGMALSKQEDKLIVCWASSTPIGGGGTINDAPCVVYNSTDLLQTMQTVSGDSSVHVGAARGNPYLVSQGFVEGEGETFYVMSADANNLYHREYRIPDGKRASETPSYAGIVDRRYVSGATVGNFSYFATYSFVGGTAIVRVIRVCNINPNPTDSLWDSWYEIQVICDQPPDASTLSDFDNVLVDAEFLFPNSGADEPVLVVSVLTDKASSPSSFCTVPLSTIDTSARSMFNYCATTTLSSNQLQFPWGSDVGPCDTAGNDVVNITECDLRVTVGPFNSGPGRLATQPTQLLNPLPGFERIQGLQLFLSLSTRVSSSKVFLVDDLVVIFTGFSNGQTRKYATRSFSDMNTNPAPERTWSLSSKEVKALSHASGSDYVYALTEDEVHRLPVEECSNFTDCSTCITSGGLLCGWCSVENKCSRRPQCANSNSSDGLRWVQTTDRCLTVDIASAVSISGEETAYPRETSSIYITLRNLPAPLTSDSEYFQCVFGGFGSGNLTAISGDIYSCVVPQIPLFQDEVFQTINFTLQSSLHGSDFGQVRNGIIFYDCLVSESCSSCTSRFSCNWCPVEFQCRSSGADCSQSPVSTSPSCPQLLPALTGDGRYYLHEGLRPQDESLVLRGENLLMPTAGFSYRCVISSTGSELMATVDANSSVTCQLPVSGIAITEAERVGRIELQWRNGTNTFIIESSNMKQLIVLYNCGDLSGDDCSGCLGLSADYRCGYCQPNCILNSLTCGSSVIQAPNFQQCGAIAVTETSPSAGPVAGITLLTVKGTNLGAYPRENISILIDGKECEIDGERTISGISLVCVVPSAEGPSSAEVTLSRSGEPPQNIGTFRYAAAMITGITPAKGTLPGSSAVIISGENLDIGNKEGTTVYTASSSSNLNELRRNFTSVQVVNSTAISAVTGVLEESGKSGFHFVIVNIDGTDVSGSVLFQYVVPRLTSVPENRIIEAGGVTVTIIGVDVDAAVEPILTLFSGNNSTGSGTCAVQSATSLSCRVPSLPDGVGVGVPFNFSITFDQFVLHSHTEALAQPYLETTANPTFEPFDQDYMLNSGRAISISGKNLQHVPESDYSVTVGDQPCTELDVSDDGTALTCLPPQEPSLAGLHSSVVTVHIGMDLTVDVGVLQYNLNILVVATPAAAAGLIILLVLGFSITCCLYVRFKRSNKERDRQFQGLLAQMELMESELAEECRRAFTELQTDMELVYDRSDQHLPFLDFRTFAIRVLFPHDAEHVVLQPLTVPLGMDHNEVMRNLDAFRQLIMNKKFLLIFVRTLEMQQGRFSLQDRCNIASLLMVAFQNDLDYATEILMALLGELVQNSVSKYHPKLLLRRTESVAEKMLTNWLCFLLYPYVVEHVGEPLYVLFRAVKSQLEKGPVDVLTGEARQSLSEEKLLRTAVDPKPVEGVVVTESGEVPIKMWDCDTISQAKEKVLDAIYKNAPVSSRPQISDVDLEFLQTGDKGLVLRDHDATNQVDGTWTRINTLGHYTLADVTASHKANTKTPVPRFCLRPREEKGAVTSVDTIGTIIANNRATAMRPDFLQDEKDQLYHIVRPDEAGAAGEGRGKIISEVFLTRLLSTKRILQPYVDDLFNAIFSMPKGHPLPKAIKYLCDFLDVQAADLSQHDPDTLHTWKTNSLPLRFWVNIIKNPEFIFDIHKSASVDSCLTVVAQAYIDGCSTSEVQYTKDTPSARLLYVNEVQGYKKKIRDFYESVQALPRISEYEMASYLREVSQANQQMYFVSESALFELFRYASTYSDALLEALDEEGLTTMAHSFESIKESLHSAQ